MQRLIFHTDSRISVLRTGTLARFLLGGGGFYCKQGKYAPKTTRDRQAAFLQQPEKSVYFRGRRENFSPESPDRKYGLLSGKAVFILCTAGYRVWRKCENAPLYFLAYIESYILSNSYFFKSN
jgi:hypothetical protein